MEEVVGRQISEDMQLDGKYYLVSVVLKPVSDVKDYNDYWNSYIAFHSAYVTSDITVYVVYFEMIDEIRLKVEAPLCGTETTTATLEDDYDWESQTNRPVVTFEGDNADKFENDVNANWLIKDTNDNWIPYSGSFSYGDKYTVGINGIRFKFPAYFDVFGINGGTKIYINDELVNNDNMDFHEDEMTPVCYAIGEVECTEHNWGEWEVVTEPTTTEEGLERRVCTGDPTHVEERAIPKLDEPDPEPEPEPEPEPIDELNTYYFDVDSSDSANTYTLESGENLEFKVECDTESDIISKFLGIEVDGEPVDISNYDATAGSVDISLHADYLDTLSEGEHTLTALFEDGEVETTFTVEKKEVVTPADKPADNPTVPTGDNMSNALWALLLIISLGVLCSVTVLAGKKYKAKYYRR